MSSPIEDYCGSQFWDIDLAWNTDSPDLTECFQQTVLVWVPCAWLILFAGLEIRFITTSTGRNIPWTLLNVTKVIANVAIIATNIADLIWALTPDLYGDSVIHDADIVTPIIKISTFVLALLLTLVGKRRGIRTSGILFIFWLLMAISGGVTYRTHIMKAVNKVPDFVSFTFISYMVYYPFVVLLLFVNCFSDAPPKYELTEHKCDHPSPELSASFLSKVVFAWLDPLAWKGYRRPLEIKDMWDLIPRDSSAVVVPRFDKHWNKALGKATTKSGTEKAKYDKMNGDVQFEPPAEKKPFVSIAPTLLKTFGMPLIVSGVLKLIGDTLAFVSPQIQKLLIDFTASDDYEWKGFLYVGVLTTTAILQTVFLAQHYRSVYIVGMGIRTAVTSAIYRKALKISNTARKETTVGEIVNLMAVDAQRLMEMALYINLLWSAPLQIGLALYFLYGTLGPSIFAGLGVMLLLIPINGIIATKTRALQLQQMQNKDKRVKLINEILNGMKVLKLYAWEPSFQSQIQEIRTKEVKVLKKAAYLSATTTMVWTCAPFLVALVTFAVYVLSDPNNVLDAQKAFVALTLFNIMNLPMVLLPMLIVASVQAAVSLKRMNKFLNAEELDENAVTHHESEKNPISVKNATFSWAKGESPVLSDINLEVESGSLVAVVGQVGCGKSSLISAFLGEMERIKGSINTKGSIAYVPQQAWIQNATLKDNIYFGLPESDSRYAAVIDGCALKQDLEMLPGGDSTEIGEKGINLSGGQKQRVSLARAVYSDKDMYFLDDPLSAVDSHVGKHIFESVIGPKGMLKNKTRILVTHGITYLPQTDKIVVLKDGRISEVGSYKELLAKKGDFADFLVEHLTAEELEDDLQDIETIRKELEENIGHDALERQISRHRSPHSESQSNLSETGSLKGSISKKGGSLRRNGSVKLPKSEEPDEEKKKGEKLIEAERSETGSVKIAVYIHYMQSVGIPITFGVFFLYAIYQACAVGANVWLSAWSNSYVNTSNPDEPVVIDTAERDLYLGVYGALGFGQGLFSYIANMTFALGTIRASVFLHNTMLAQLMRSPMSFFDTTPLGRIVNRFSKDVDVADNLIPMSLRMCVTMLLSVIGTIVVISYSTPIFLVVIIPIGIMYYVMQFVYVATSRQLKRLESVTRSPIYSHFGETISGAPVIRAYSQEARFIKESEHRVDSNQACYYPSIMANRWLSVRLETIGNLVVFFTSLFAVLSRSTNAGLVGLSISYSLSITQTLNMFVRMTSDVETNIVSVERMKEYSETSQEAKWDIPDKRPAKDWPQQGNIEFRNLQLRYREGLELVLKGISFTIKGGEKIGIVGRTGAGKSSLTLGLFRIVEPAGGTILIDGVDITQIGLHNLRSHLTIIPQDPVLFSGTLRMNLDPFEQYSDDQVWTALELAHLKTFAKSLAAGLSHEVAEGGENLSVGQRQLICLARALLRKTKILILDEATAAVDLETDDLIQATIRKEFAECTVLTIAHRLNTIMDSTRVLVLDKGEVREFDSPTNLLNDSSSIFYGMAKDANLVSAQEVAEL